mmetsp:Transcript_1858/g.4133  ORF Transcript_1858/g.4133 Transcript_1858/m.4133 type:complete len:378 (+) Transcript_1858:1374-2507(+)
MAGLGEAGQEHRDLLLLGLEVPLEGGVVVEHDQLVPADQPCHQLHHQDTKGKSLLGPLHPTQQLLRQGVRVMQQINRGKVHHPLHPGALLLPGDQALAGLLGPGHLLQLLAGFALAFLDLLELFEHLLPAPVIIVVRHHILLQGGLVPQQEVGRRSCNLEVRAQRGRRNDVNGVGVEPHVLVGQGDQDGHRLAGQRVLGPFQLGVEKLLQLGGHLLPVLALLGVLRNVPHDVSHQVGAEELVFALEQLEIHRQSADARKLPPVAEQHQGLDQIASGEAMHLLLVLLQDIDQRLGVINLFLRVQRADVGKKHHELIEVLRGLLHPRAEDLELGLEMVVLQEELFLVGDRVPLDLPLQHWQGGDAIHFITHGSKMASGV